MAYRSRGAISAMVGVGVRGAERPSLDLDLRRVALQDRTFRGARAKVGVKVVYASERANERASEPVEREAWRGAACERASERDNNGRGGETNV